MGAILGAEQVIMIGQPVVLDSQSPVTTSAVLFEDEGDTGYFYAVDTTRDHDSILDALHIYNVSNVTDKEIPSKVQIAWSEDGLKAALVINDYVHAIFDFESCRGYCRTGFPPNDNWSAEGHGWDDRALELFR